jgi:tetratricopeptide (TPR) repeat protein
MALAAEHVRATAQALEYRTGVIGRAQIIPWARLRAVSTQIQPAWAGAEVTLTLCFEGREQIAEGIPLPDGRRLEIFGDFGAARDLIQAARQRAPQALISPQAQLLISLPRPEGIDEQWYRRKAREYGFAAEASASLGRLHLWQGRLLKADNDFHNAVSRARLDSNGWRGLGLTRLLAGDAGGAKEAFDRFTALGGRDSETQYLRALTLYMQRRFEQASTELGRLAGPRPDDAGLRDLLACSLVQQWRIGEALGQLDRIGAGANQGWRLMAQKCRLCAQGHQAYQERLTRDRVFRWGERWKMAAARLAAAVGIIWSMARFLWRRYLWALVVLVAAAALGFFLFGEKGLTSRVRDQLADAQGRAPNLPCWYVLLIQRRSKSLLSRRYVVEEIERRLTEVRVSGEYDHRRCRGSHEPRPEESRASAEDGADAETP